jgi:hypothetical protein
MPANLTNDRSPWPVRVLWLAAALAAVQAVSLLAWYWPGTMPDTHTSGVWIALADDVAHGDFYRPLHSELGTGGTRYMPLFFVLHGGLIKLGIAPLAAGVLLTLGSVVLLILSVQALLRRLGVPADIAWPAALLMLGAVSFEMMLLTVKGDFLAAAFNLGGITAALAWQQDDRRRRLGLAATLFAAAFLTKITTVFGLAAVAAWLIGRREGRPAAQLLGATGLMMLAGIGLAFWASDGRMLESFRAVVSGDTTLAFALTAPLRFMAECAGDPLACVLLVGGAGCAVGLIRAGGHALALWLASITAAVTLVIFASPGTGANHLIDPLALAAIGLAVTLSQPRRGRPWAGLTAGLFGLGIIIAWLPGVPSIRRFFTQHHKPEVAAVREFTTRAGAGVKPMFAENPLIPILAGERPFVADLFNLELMMRRDPGLRAEILKQLRAGKFGSVVLSNWPDVFSRDVAAPDDPLIEETLPRLRARDRLAAGFYPALEARYRIVLVRRPYIYFLRDDLPFAPAP